MAHGDGGEVIMDMKTGDMTTLDGKKKEYYVITKADMQAMMAKMQEQMNSPEAKKAQEQMKNLPPEMREEDGGHDGRRHDGRRPQAGTSRKIAGYSCDELDDDDRRDVQDRAVPHQRAAVPDASLRRVPGVRREHEGDDAKLGPMAKGMGQMSEKMKEMKGFPLAQHLDGERHGAQLLHGDRGDGDQEGAHPALRLGDPGGLHAGRQSHGEGDAAQVQQVQVGVDPLVSTSWLARGLCGRQPADRRRALVPGPGAARLGRLPGGTHPRRRLPGRERDLSAPGGRRGGARRPASLAPDGAGGRASWGAPESAQQTPVVAYDDQAGATAARLWYVLRAHGHDDVAVLDGGLVKWIARRPVRSKRPWRCRSRKSSFRGFRAGMVVAQGGHAGRRGPRAGPRRARRRRYRGETEPIDPRAGHIPGARSAPFAGNLPGIRCLSSAARPSCARASRPRRRSAGADRLLRIRRDGLPRSAWRSRSPGLRGRLYAGRWSEWSADPALPVGHWRCGE